MTGRTPFLHRPSRAPRRAASGARAVIACALLAAWIAGPSALAQASTTDSGLAWVLVGTLLDAKRSPPTGVGERAVEPRLGGGRVVLSYELGACLEQRIGTWTLAAPGPLVRGDAFPVDLAITIDEPGCRDARASGASVEAAPIVTVYANPTSVDELAEFRVVVSVPAYAVVVAYVYRAVARD